MNAYNGFVASHRAFDGLWILEAENIMLERQDQCLVLSLRLISRTL
jgi:hypothetical protein